MNDPVITADGQSYERLAIERWLRDHDTSPRTNERLSTKRLIPNIALRQQIADFRAEHGYSPPRPYYPPPHSSSGRGGGDGSGSDEEQIEGCSSVPGWAVATVFVAVWLTAWAAGEYTVATEVVEEFESSSFSLTTLFTIIWLGAWSFGGCVACSAIYGLFCRECFPREGEAGVFLRNANANSHQPQQQEQRHLTVTQPAGYDSIRNGGFGVPEVAQVREQEEAIEDPSHFGFP